jgi:DNA-binding transcriptional MerR regulator
MENKYINIKQAAKILGVSTLTLRNWDNSGKFPAGRHPISNYRVYSIADIEDLIMKMGTRIVGSSNIKPTRSEVKKLIVNHLTDDE